MREKFFSKGSYQLRLDDIRPRDAKPHKRIHLNCSMALDGENEQQIAAAPTRIRRVWEIVANSQLDVFKVPLSTQLKGIDIEMFACDPTGQEKKVPLLVAISNAILRDIHLDREKIDEKHWETRLYFSVGISWDSKVWKWGAEYVFMECFAKFSQSQGEFFDENEADFAPAPIASAEAERLKTVEVEELAKEIAPHAPEPAQAPAIDPLIETPKGNWTGGHSKGKGKRKPLPFEGNRGGRQPHA
jgi:hypothetical protein